MSERISCQSIEKYQVLIRGAAHAWLADEPSKDGGDGLGPGPFELLLSALGSCTSITVVYYAGRSGIALERLWIDITDEWVGKGEAEKYHVNIKLRVRGQFQENDLERLERASHRCPVKRLLEKAAVITTSIEAV